MAATFPEQQIAAGGCHERDVRSPLDARCFTLNRPEKIVRLRSLIVPGQIVGKIVAFSQQGNLVSDISAEQLREAPRDESVVIRCDEHETNCLFECEHQQPDTTLIAILGSSGRLELEIVGDSAKIMLGVPLGEPIEVCW